jgi:hypothetical protein
MAEVAGEILKCGGGNDVEEAVAWENGGKKETWKDKEEMVT